MHNIVAIGVVPGMVATAGSVTTTHQLKAPHPSEAHASEATDTLGEKDPFRPSQGFQFRVQARGGP